MNLERTTFEPAPRVRSATHRYEEGEDGFIIFTVSRIRPNGTPGFVQTVFKLDGESYPTYTENGLALFLTTGTPSTNMVSYKAIGTHTIEQTSAGGTTRTMVVSTDGQTMTMSATGTNFNATVVFDRVQ